MVERRLLQLGIIVWAAVAVAVAVPSVTRVNPDARVLIGFASVAFPACALLASFGLARGRDRLAGALLLVSVATPTYFAWVINVLALFIGLALLVVPTLLVKSLSGFAQCRNASDTDFDRTGRRLKRGCPSGS